MNAKYNIDEYYFRHPSLNTQALSSATIDHPFHSTTIAYEQPKNDMSKINKKLIHVHDELENMDEKILELNRELGFLKLLKINYNSEKNMILKVLYHLLEENCTIAQTTFCQAYYNNNLLQNATPGKEFESGDIKLLTSIAKDCGLSTIVSDTLSRVKKEVQADFYSKLQARGLTEMNNDRKEDRDFYTLNDAIANVKKSDITTGESAETVRDVFKNSIKESKRGSPVSEVLQGTDPNGQDSKILSQKRRSVLAQNIGVQLRSPNILKLNTIVSKKEKNTVSRTTLPDIFAKSTTDDKVKMKEKTGTHIKEIQVLSNGVDISKSHKKLAKLKRRAKRRKERRLEKKNIQFISNWASEASYLTKNQKKKK